MLPSVQAEVSPVPPAQRQRELPLCDFRDLEGSAGFVRLVRLLVAVPLVVLGALALAAGLALGHLLVAILDILVVSVCLYSLWDDTRLTKAVDRLRRGELAPAQAELERVATSRRRSTLARQRAQGHLATIAWRRVDHDAALRWTQERLAGLLAARGPAMDRFMTRASEIQLLALLGRTSEARTELAKMGSPPDGAHAAYVDACTRLLVAFASGAAQATDIELERLRPVVLSEDRTGLGRALLAWMHAAREERDRAAALVHAVREDGDLAYLQLHFPRLLRWVEGYDAAHRYG